MVGEARAMQRTWLAKDDDAGKAVKVLGAKKAKRRLPNRLSREPPGNRVRAETSASASPVQEPDNLRLRN